MHNERRNYRNVCVICKLCGQSGDIKELKFRAVTSGISETGVGWKFTKLNTLIKFCLFLYE